MVIYVCSSKYIIRFPFISEQPANEGGTGACLEAEERPIPLGNADCREGKALNGPAKRPHPSRWKGHLPQQGPVCKVQSGTPLPRAHVLAAAEEGGGVTAAPPPRLTAQNGLAAPRGHLEQHVVLGVADYRCPPSQYMRNAFTKCRAAAMPFFPSP